MFRLRLNHICSETNSFDKQCNDLETFLLEIIGFKNKKNLKPYSVRAALTDISEVGRCEPCDGKRLP